MTLSLTIVISNNVFSVIVKIQNDLSENSNLCQFIIVTKNLTFLYSMTYRYVLCVTYPKNIFCVILYNASYSEFH